MILADLCVTLDVLVLSTTCQSFPQKVCFHSSGHFYQHGEYIQVVVPLDLKCEFKKKVFYIFLLFVVLTFDMFWNNLRAQFFLLPFFCIIYPAVGTNKLLILACHLIYIYFDSDQHYL